VIRKSESKAFEPWKSSSKGFQLCATSRKVIKEARERAAQTGENPDLVAHAAMIRRLGKRVLEDIVHIGCRLKEAKDIVGHGGWGKWLQTEFGWSEDTAQNFMRVYGLSKNRNFRDLEIAPSALYLLAKPSTPEAVRDKVFDAAEAGEKITVKDIKEAVKPKVKVVEGLRPATPAEKNNRRVAKQMVELNREFIDLAKFARPGTIIEPELRAELRALFEPNLSALSQGREIYSRIIDDICGNVDAEPSAVAAEPPEPMTDPAVMAEAAE
jgi:hypothetical protein